MASTSPWKVGNVLLTGRNKVRSSLSSLYGSGSSGGSTPPPESRLQTRLLVAIRAHDYTLVTALLAMAVIEEGNWPSGSVGTADGWGNAMGISGERRVPPQPRRRNDASGLSVNEEEEEEEEFAEDEKRSIISSSLASRSRSSFCTSVRMRAGSGIGLRRRRREEDAKERRENCLDFLRLNPSTERKDTILTHAARLGNVNIVRLLCMFTRDRVDLPPDAQCKGEGVTPLYIAIQEGNLEAAKVLIEFGSNVDVLCVNGRYACLHLAAQLNRVEACRLLVKASGGDVNVRSSYEETPLFLAAAHGSLEAVKVLVEELNADVKVHSKHVDSVLRMAAWNSKWEVVDYLLRCERVDLTEEMERLKRNLASPSSSSAYLWGGNKALDAELLGRLRLAAFDFFKPVRRMNAFKSWWPFVSLPLPLIFLRVLPLFVAETLGFGAMMNFHFRSPRDGEHHHHQLSEEEKEEEEEKTIPEDDLYARILMLGPSAHTLHRRFSTPELPRSPSPEERVMAMTRLQTNERAVHRISDELERKAEFEIYGVRTERWSRFQAAKAEWECRRKLMEILVEEEIALWEREEGETARESLVAEATTCPVCYEPLFPHRRRRGGPEVREESSTCTSRNDDNDEEHLICMTCFRILLAQSHVLHSFYISTPTCVVCRADVAEAPILVVRPKA